MKFRENSLIPQISRFSGFLAITGILLGAPNSLAVTLVYPSSGNHVHKAFDPGGNPPPDSFVVLNPDPVENNNEFFLLPGVSQAIQDELSGTDSNGNPIGDTDFTDWTFNYNGSTLNGTIYIDEYKAQYKADHLGGGLINIRYKKGAGDPDNLRWIQMITTTDPKNNATSPYIDPFPNDCPVPKPPLTVRDNGPFYYDAGCDLANHINGAVDHGFGTDYDLHFFDFSSREHPLPVPFDPIKWKAELYLVSWDGMPTATGEPNGTITFHDGIQWGWEMRPIPEPSTILGSVIALGIGFLTSKKSSRISDEDS
ncbi:MAG: PEP-CTERM sorting domain-containing protein [Microcystis sp. LE19-338.1B]|jgi:hypothetical protein|nr:PEP-CTERM sorting domain-containing protein [Microcystis sp. LE19-338.1B]MCZ8357707.1 PEP-CTERM sorting domain-containing protein [Microcystis sp. LE19-388.1G]